MLTMTSNSLQRDKHNLDGLLIVVSGPSGVGKGTVCEEILRQHPDIKLSTSITTRERRPGEKEGVHYFFRSREEFETMIENGMLLEYAHVYGDYYYGTPKQYVHDELANGNDVLLEIDVNGALQVKKNFPKAILIFIAPPSLYELERRLKERGTETGEYLNDRLKASVSELEKMRSYDYMVVNDTVTTAREKIDCIITAEKCKIENNRDVIERLTRRA
ncbi:guanylate kinase [Clostridia bacterium OttesenSCG-928-F22]|nr:guanylate kinase [Clostridia bacterium OttesenSCG-928-F22]